ncbi:MAG: hypothetical protein CMN02_09715, partial [Roseibacillus sp.]|nr:hypothetical protein [Roseibacillus sp.]
SPMLAHYASGLVGISRSLGPVLKRDGAADVALLLGRKYRSDQSLHRDYESPVKRGYDKIYG